MIITKEQYLKLPNECKQYFEKGGDFNGMKVNDGRKTSVDNPYQRGETIRKNVHPTWLLNLLN